MCDWRFLLFILKEFWGALEHLQVGICSLHWFLKLPESKSEEKFPQAVGATGSPGEHADAQENEFELQDSWTYF